MRVSDFEAIGGAEGVRRLVDAFYDRMERLPEAAAIRALHDDDLSSDRHKLAAFLSGWLGGPPLYWMDWDDATIAARHAHLPVDAAAANAWLRCMRGALEEVVGDPALIAGLLRRFTRAAHGARNR